MDPHADERLGRRLALLRGRATLAAALEDLQHGVAWGAAAGFVVALAHLFGVGAATPLRALSVAAVIALAFPLAGRLRRGASDRLLADTVDTRLGLHERVSTAVALHERRAAATLLSPLVADDALRSLERVPVARLRAAFRPVVHRRPLFVGGAALLLGIVAFRMEPIEASVVVPVDPVVAAREAAEREDAARAARRIQEAARRIEETATPKEEALRQVAADIRRRADAMLQDRPKAAKAIAQFKQMQEVARRKVEEMAGTDLERLEQMKESGELGQPDERLQALVEKLLASRMPEMQDSLNALNDALKGLGNEEWSAEDLEALQADLEQLADILEQNPDALEGRDGLRQSLGQFGDPELLRELAQEMARLQEILREQGWEACRAQNDSVYENLPAELGEMPRLSKEQIQAMIERLKELQRLAELGQLAGCQGCQLSGGT